MARPMRTRPEDLAENVLVPDAQKKMSRRDIVRAQFLIKFRNTKKIKGSFVNRATVEVEKMRDIDEIGGA